MYCNVKIADAGGKPEKIVLSPNTNTPKCILDIKDASFQIDFTVENTLRTVLVSMQRSASPDDM